VRSQDLNGLGRTHPNETDGTFPAGKFLTKPLGPRRVCGSHPPYIQNTWEKSGRRTAEGVKETTCIRAKRRSGLTALRKNPADFLAQILKASGENISPGIEHDHPITSKLIVLGADRLPHSAFDSVPLYRFTDRARHGKAESRRCAGRCIS